MYDQIKKMILEKKNDIDDQTLYYYTNYFYVLVERNLIPEGIKLEDLIENGLYFSRKIVFYDEGSDVYKRLGPDTKGLCDPETKNLYIRNDLKEPLREMTIYHEFHHAVQTNKNTGDKGINQNFYVGRMIMEAQTQWFAEEVYKTIHNVEYGEREISSEQLRMLGNGRVISALHNYEMYDAMLSKLAILLDVPKDFFVTINFLYDQNKGYYILKDKYEEKAKEKNLPLSFYNMLYKLDYTYVVDYLAYIENEDKETILSGKETEKIGIYDQGESLSLEKQRRYIKEFDFFLVMALIDNGFEYKDFLKYIIDDYVRITVTNYANDKRKSI